jgi:transcriptional regulator with PAS, ATPase and Fis domain
MAQQATLEEITSAQRLLNEFVTSNVGVAIFDQELRYEAINSRLARTHGLPPELHLGRPLREVVGEIAAAIEPALKATLSTGQPMLNVQVEGFIQGTQEWRQWASSFFPLIDADGQVKHVAAVVAELSPRRVLANNSQEEIMQTAAHGDILRSWKEIASYLRTCSKTVQRWERRHNLPIRRVTVAKGSVVFALRSEIDEWVRSSSLKRDARQ